MSEMVALALIDELRSADWRRPMTNTLQALRRDYQRWVVGGEQAHYKDRQFGGPDAYIAYLAADFALNPIREPLVVRQGYVMEGNHRYLAAHRAGLTHIPVTYM